MTFIAPQTMTVAPWADPAVLVALLGVVAAAVGAGGAWEVVKARRAKPISADQAERAQRAAESKIVDSASTIIDEWQAMLAAVNAQHTAELDRVHAHYARELDPLRARIHRAEERIGTLEAANRELEQANREHSRTIFTLQATLARVVQWWEGVVADWSRIRQHENPPTGPPVDIRGVT